MVIVSTNFENPEIAYAEAERRIDVALKTRSKKLYLGGSRYAFDGESDLIGLTKFPPQIADLKHAEEINIANTEISDLSPLSGSTSLRQLILSNTAVSDLAPVSSMVNLQVLNASNTKIQDLTSLAGHASLKNVNVSETMVSDLGPIAKILGLKHLNINGSKVVHLSALAGHSTLHTILANTTATSDLSPLMASAALRSLHVSHTRVSSIEPLLPCLRRLEILDVSNTGVSDIRSLSENSALRILDISNTLVENIEAIALCVNLEELDLRNTQVLDLSPIRHLGMMTNSKRRNTISLYSFETRGLSFAGAHAARNWPFSALALLGQPSRTVETLNYLRRQADEVDIWPSGYERPEGIEQVFSHGGTNHLVERVNKLDAARLDAIQSRPSTHDFLVRDGKIIARPHRSDTPDSGVVNELLPAVRQKTAIAGLLLVKANAPRRLTVALDRLRECLEPPALQIVPGKVLMVSRTIEAELKTYDTREGRNELSDEGFSALEDVANSLADFRGCFPQLAKLEAERLSQGLLAENVEFAKTEIQKVIVAARESPAVASSAVNALEVGKREVADAEEIISGTGSLEAKSEAYERRARTVGQMMLDVRKFVAQSFGVVAKEVSEIGTPVWAEAKDKGPNAIYAIAVSGLALAIAGPTIAFAAFAASFKPLQDYAKEILGKSGQGKDGPH